ncbi:MAG: translation elongation factor Ts [Christensenellaceae bacterium]|nr:translation elongation factor Ts [Christensenellaceae bacterium]
MASDIIKLKELTGAGVLDCKKALDEVNGDFDKAVAFLREKGQAKALKKGSSDRIAGEGVVGSYIHMNGKIGVLVEINCETDFAAQNDKFITLVKDVAMHIAAANPLFLSSADVPSKIIEKEKEILKNQIAADDKLKSKPANVIETMINGRVEKYYQENCLLEQSFIKDPSKKIKDVVNDTISHIGEKITVRRFTRYEMGEGIEKKEENFAEEVSKQLKK